MLGKLRDSFPGPHIPEVYASPLAWVRGPECSLWFGPISSDDRRSSVSLLPSAILEIPSTGLMDLDLWTLAGPEPTS